MQKSLAVLAKARRCFAECTTNPEQSVSVGVAPLIPPSWPLQVYPNTDPSTRCLGGGAVYRLGGREQQSKLPCRDTADKTACRSVGTKTLARSSGMNRIGRDRKGDTRGFPGQTGSNGSKFIQQGWERQKGRRGGGGRARPWEKNWYPTNEKCNRQKERI